MTDIKTFKSVLIITAALGWWGIWFPELAVWGNAVCVATEQSEAKSIEQLQAMDMNIVREICDGLKIADRSQIQIKSRLLIAIDQYFQKK